MIILSYSRALHLKFFFDQTMENFLRGHVHAFQAWRASPESFSMTIYAVLCWSAAATRSTSILGFWTCAPTITLPLALARCARAIRKDGSSEPFATCANHSGQAAGSPLWKTVIVRHSPGEIKSLISAPGRETIPAPSSRFFAEEQTRLLPLPSHPFEIDLVLPLCAGKTIYLRFDLNDYSIPPDAVGRTLTLVASESRVRILEGTKEIAFQRTLAEQLQLWRATPPGVPPAAAATATPTPGLQSPRTSAWTSVPCFDMGSSQRLSPRQEIDHPELYPSPGREPLLLSQVSTKGGTCSCRSIFAHFCLTGSRC